MSLDDDHQVDVLLATEHDERNPALSPNGLWLAYDSTESGQREVYGVPYPDVTGKVQPPQVHVVLNWFDQLQRLVPSP